MGQPSNSAPPWPEQWAVQASVDAERVGNRLEAVTARGLTRGETATKAAVERHLEQARQACRCTGRYRQRGWRDRWRGSSVERAYLHLHSAKIFLVDLLPPADLEALVPDVATRLAMVLDRNDPRRAEAEAQLRATTQEQPGRRAVVKQAMEVAYDASDEQYVRLRDFRNIILLTALAMFVLTGLLVFFVAIFPDAIPLCFKPGVTTAATNTQAAQQLFSVCPSGDLPQQQPEAGDILIVAGLGAIGGSLGALVAIRNLRGTSTPYSVATALAILKGPSGALTAIIGMLLLAGGFVPGLTNLDSQRQILAYALVFGIAQQLVTRVADDRAQQLLNQLPSKDPQGQTAQVASLNRPAVAPAGDAGPVDGEAPTAAPLPGAPTATNGARPASATNGARPTAPADAVVAADAVDVELPADALPQPAG
jgi:hypothetical protein